MNLRAGKTGLGSQLFVANIKHFLACDTNPRVSDGYLYGRHRSDFYSRRADAGGICRDGTNTGGRRLIELNAARLVPFQPTAQPRIVKPTLNPQ